MSHEANAKQYAELLRQIGAAYAVMAATLATLPIPMRIPVQKDEPDWAMRALSRAWTLAEAEPLDAFTIGRIRDMITAWTTAFELAANCDEAGPAIWRLRGIEAQLTRFRVSWRSANRRISGRYGTGLPDSP